MSDINDFKQSLLNTAWRLYKTVQVESTSGPVELAIRIPPGSVTKGILAKAKDLKESDAQSGVEVLDWMYEAIAACVFHPNGARPLFTPEEAAAWPGASAVMGDCMAAINSGHAVEKAKGN